MWKPFHHENHLYMIKVVQDDNLIFYLTDLQNIWIQNISKDDLLKQFQECNPLIDIKIDEAVSEVVNILNRISDIEGIEVINTSDKMQLHVKSVKSEFKILFKLTFTKSTSEIFLKEITVPLIQTVKHLEERQNMLCNLIKKKDRELEEYQLEKGIISRDDLITEKFDESKMSSVDMSMMNIFGTSKSFWEAFVKNHGNIETKIEEVKTEPWNHMKRKRKVYSSKTTTKKGKGIDYSEGKNENI